MKLDNRLNGRWVNPGQDLRIIVDIMHSPDFSGIEKTESNSDFRKEQGMLGGVLLISLYSISLSLDQVEAALVCNRLREAVDQAACS